MINNTIFGWEMLVSVFNFPKNFNENRTKTMKIIKITEKAWSGKPKSVTFGMTLRRA